MADKEKDQKGNQERKSARTDMESANKASRLNAFVAQAAEIQAAVGVARAKGFSTNGKTVGIQVIAASYAVGSGSSVPDIGVAVNLEADEEDPDIVRPGTPNPYETPPQPQIKSPAKIAQEVWQRQGERVQEKKGRNQEKENHEQVSNKDTVAMKKIDIMDLDFEL